MDLRLFLLVCAGGAVGSGARFAVAVALARPGFPWATLAVNLVGSFLLGAVLVAAGSGRISEPTRLALGTGVLGGFTTYSAFSAETWRYMELGAWPTALTYVAVTLIGCLAATGLGMAAARAIG